MTYQMKNNPPAMILNLSPIGGIPTPGAEPKLRAIFDNCFQFIALLDKQGRLLEINRCSLQAAGVERDQVINKYFWDTFFWTTIIDPKHRDEFIKTWPRICQGEFIRFEVGGALPNGESRTVDFSVTPVMNENSELSFAVAEARDVTQYKKLENELVASNGTLSRINAELEDFAVLASHDLRQPLQSISMNATILSRLLPADSSSAIREQLEHIKMGVGRMNLLLESILDYARSTKLSQEKTTVKCADIVREALDCLASSLDKAVIKIDWASLPEIVGNRIQLLRVFQNLLSNAIKFQQAGRPCVVSVSAVKEDHRWIFAVTDNGIGIQANDQATLFKRFNQIPSEHSRVGLGAGLSICKDIIEQHGGAIWVESRIGEGTTFYLALPLAEGREDSSLDC